MGLTCVECALSVLSAIQAYELDSSDDYYSTAEAFLACLHRSSGPVLDGYWEEAYIQVQSCKRELMFLKMMKFCFVMWDCDLPNTNSILNSQEDLSRHFSWCESKQEWDVQVPFWEARIQLLKHLMVDDCRVLLDSWLQCKPLPSDQILRFLEIVLRNLEVLVSARESTDYEELLRELKLSLQSFATSAACIAFVLWAKAADQEFAIEAKISQLLSEIQQRIIKPYGSDFTPLYLKVIKLLPSDDTILHGEVVAGFIDLHLHDLLAESKDDWLTVREGLIFLLMFMITPPEECANDEHLALVCNKIDNLFSKCTYIIFSPNDIVKQNFAFDKMLLSDLVENLEETMGEVKEKYVKIPNSSSYNFSRTNGLGFYDFLLRNLERLKEKLDSETNYIPFARNLIIRIEEELVSLRPLVIGIFELQKQLEEFKDTWTQVINLVYGIEHIINSCSVPFHPIWYNMACLFDILNQIEDVKKKLQNVNNCKMHYIEVLPPSIESSSAPLEPKRFSITNEEVVVGFEEERRKIIDELIRGHESLGIISIIGMGGLGKTTLAHGVFNSNTIRFHFHQRGFVSVSQVLNRRNFFVNILCGIKKCKNEEFNSMSEDDLAHDLLRCLSGQMYLIVIDDIWDIKAWDAVKSSFPDDKNRSRIIFTTRELQVALDAKSSLHDLQPRSDNESLKLLHMKAFGEGDCPPNFSKVGNMIVKNCKGLPLAIVVVAGLLKSSKTSSTRWEEIAKTTSELVGRECKDIIGLSYKHLPEHLKSCFLYMGIYQEDEEIRTKHLRQLWISEGFVSKSMTESFRIVAKGYLSDLADRNLITPVRRSGRGGITRCRVHDIIRDFCRRQAEEDNFLWMGSNSPNATKGNLYRISVQRSFEDLERSTLKNVHSLLCWYKEDYKWRFDMERSKLAQVLHLQGEVDLVFSNHPVHLRYFSVRFWDQKITESICNLWNLETFIVQGGKTAVGKNAVMLPKTIWKMKSLRHLEFRTGCSFDLDKAEDAGNHQLLDNFESLSDLWLLDDRTATAVLQRMPNIEKLTCCLIGSEWNGKVFPIDILSKLESLCLYTRLRAVPKNLRFPSTLKRLEFGTVNAGQENILSVIGELPYLEVLRLELNLTRWNVEDEQFQKLKYLEVEGRNLEEWNVSFSCLGKLILKSCKRLEEIPASFAELSTLQKIEVRYCNKELESSAIQVQNEQMDNGNEVQLEIN